MKIKKICRQCGKGFEVFFKNRNHKFCGNKCSHEWHRGKNLYNYNRLERVCLVCKKKFKISPSLLKIGTGEYCSIKCKGIGTRTAKRVKLACLNCGKNFEVRTSSVQLKKHFKFCTIKCFWEYNRGQNNSSFIRVKKKCDWCGKEFKGCPSLIKKRKYCSRKCLSKAMVTKVEKECQVCGKKFKAGLSKRGQKTSCSRKCAGIRQRRRRVPLIKQKCGYCGKEFENWKNDRRQKPHKYCSYECSSQSTDVLIRRFITYFHLSKDEIDKEIIGAKVLLFKIKRQALSADNEMEVSP